MTPRQQDQKWVEDTRAEYLRRAEVKPRPGLLAFAQSLTGRTLVDPEGNRYIVGRRIVPEAPAHIGD